jgi:hypothetical protein
MRRISTATRVIDKFGTGKDGFTNGNAVSGIAATDLEDVWFDHVQEEISNVVEGAGLTLDTSNRAQLLAAIQRMFAPAIGVARNVSMSIASASASATLTADEITVGVALGGKKFLLSNFSQTINLATTGAGGMDTGSAPASSFVGIYAAFNPTTGARTLFAQSANGVKLPEVYGGSNIPAGYTASALVSVVPTNASSQFAPVFQADRSVSFAASNVLTSSAVVNASPTIVNALIVPMNAKVVGGFIQAGSTAASAVGIAVYPTSVSIGGKIMAANVGAGQSQAVPFERLPISTPQRLFYTSSNGTGTPAFTISLDSYDF